MAMFVTDAQLQMLKIFEIAKAGPVICQNKSTCINLAVLKIVWVNSYSRELDIADECRESVKLGSERMRMWSWAR